MVKYFCQEYSDDLCGLADYLVYSHSYDEMLLYVERNST